MATGTAIRTLSGAAEGHRIAYGPNGRFLAASSLSGGNVRLWDAHTYRELAVLPHGNRVYGLAFSPDGTRLATGCGDNTIRLWDLVTWKRSLRAAGARVLRPHGQFQPGRYPAGHRFRRRDVANLGHGPAADAGSTAGRHPPSTGPGPANKSREAGAARRSPVVKPAAGLSAPSRDDEMARDRARDSVLFLA